MKSILLAVAALSFVVVSTTASAATAKLGSTVTKADGSVRRMTYAEAVKYCARRGGLPTAKQFALALNPDGVSDEAVQGFLKFLPRNQPAFYYSPISYDAPSSVEGREWYWTSSVDSNFYVYAYAFNGNNGYLFHYDRENENAVRCNR